jgi:hypothetical protein
MGARLKKLGVVVAILGLLFVVGGGVAAYKVKQGSTALNAYAPAENVMLTYDENGNYTSHGDAKMGAAILDMLENTWKYPVNKAELDPKDPLVNTGSEYMLQMATVSYHVLYGTTTVVLPAGSPDATYDGKTYHAGDSVTYVNDGKYWADFDTTNPIEAAARGQLWQPTAHGLVGELGVGAVTASTLQLGYGVAAVTAGLGATLILAGLGLAWAAAAAAAPVVATAAKAEPKAKDKK